MKTSSSGVLFRFGLCAASLLVFYGCTTTAAKKAMNKPAPADAYSAFDSGSSDSSKRKASKVEAIKDDEDPEQAVSRLVEQLGKPEAAYQVSAEDQLKAWGAKQGVGKIVYQKVRILLKSDRIEVKAPALRLIKMFGGSEAVGDLIEALADRELAIRQDAFNSLRARTHRDFSFNPEGGEVARLKSVDDWRQWWQAEQRKVAVQPASVYEEKPLSEPKVVSPKGRNKTASD